MAKQKTILPVSGMLDDKVYVDSKHGKFVRKAPKPGQKKDEPGLKSHYVRTGFLNNLAGGVNEAIKKHAGKLKPPNFYNILNKCFRKEPLDNRFVLLKLLEGMEVNKKYPLSKLTDARLTVWPTEDEMIVKLEVEDHPSASVGRYKVNCYSFEVTLLSWIKDADRPTSFKKYSAWIFLKDDLLDFTFRFERIPETVEWLVCLTVKLGFDEVQIPSLIGEGMQLVLAGTFNEKDIALLAKRKEEKKRAGTNAAKPVEDQVERVQATGRRKRGLPLISPQRRKA